jgi:hypothetical protein
LKRHKNRKVRQGGVDRSGCTDTTFSHPQLRGGVDLGGCDKVDTFDGGSREG